MPWKKAQFGEERPFWELVQVEKVDIRVSILVRKDWGRSPGAQTVK